MEFAIFVLDVVNSLSIFTKVSQDRNISRKSVNDSVRKCLIILGEFYDDPSGKNEKALLISLLRVLYQMRSHISLLYNNYVTKLKIDVMIYQ